jgi:hypothetical protein
MVCVGGLRVRATKVTRVMAREGGEGVGNLFYDNYIFPNGQ